MTRAGAARRVGGWLLLAGALVAVTLGCWSLYHLESSRIADAQRHREALRIGVMTHLLRSELRPAIDILRLLADGDGLRDFLDTDSPAGLQLAVRSAQSVSISHPEFDQVRLIDASGMELLRVNAGGIIVAAPRLQDKSTRNYFIEASTLPPGGLYVSALSLNVEDGQIELPHKPMLRLAIPVFDSAGNRRGIYVIDYLGDKLIQELQQALPAFAHRLRLLDIQGYWLKSDDPFREWGFQLPDREAFTLARSDPKLWQRVAAEPEGQLSTPGGGPFTWRRVNTDEMVGVQPGPLLSEKPFLIVATEVNAAEWSELFAGLRRIMLLVMPGLLLLTLFCAWLIRGWRGTVLQLRATNQSLEERVRERTAELASINEALREHEKLLEETGELAAVGGWEFDPATGEGTWTAQIARIHGLDPGLTVNRDLGLSFYPPAEQARLAEAINKSQQDGTPYDLELKLVCARGQHKWVRTKSIPVMQDGRVVRMRGSMQDITDRKESELRLQQQLRRLHLLERTTRAIGERQDLQSILQVVTTSLEAQLPLDLACVLLYDPPETELTVAAMGPAGTPIAARISLAPETRVPIGANGLSRCVQGHLVYEPDLSQAHGPLAQQLAGAGLRSLVIAPLSIEDMVFGVLVAARVEPAAFSSGDCEFLRQISEHSALAVHQARLHGALQVAYEDLAATQQAVMQQERLRVLGQMASGIAHDINNAVSPIMLYTGSLLESETQLSDRARHALHTIQQAVSDVAETVARLREFYRPRALPDQLQSMRLNALVMQVPDLTRARWQSMPQRQGIVIDLQLDLEPMLPPVCVIENEVREALVNLVFNAVDAMPHGGRLVLRTRRASEGRVSVEVTDTGIGMDEETRRRCLEPFFTTKGERGTGLGLAMVYGVMQRHEGEVQIDSSPGVGTTIRLVFHEAATRPERVAPEMAAPVRGLHLLLVDDDPILLRSLSETLELDAHTILTAGDGGKALELFRSSLQPGARPVSLVITDLGMPNIDGRAVAAGIKQAAPQVPVVMLTGWGERLLAEGQAVPHVDRVIGKPPRLHELRAALADLAGAAAQLQGEPQQVQPPPEPPVAMPE